MPGRDPPIVSVGLVTGWLVVNVKVRATPVPRNVLFTLLEAIENEESTGG